MADFEKDDITKGFEDVELSQAEIERRQDAFQREVQKRVNMITKPKQFDANTRRDAVRWLGEAGDPEAISALVKVYQKDKTAGMKDEAAYALGQLKALGEALEDPEISDDAYDKLDQIVLHGKFGKRASATNLLVMEVALGILAVVLFGVGIFFSSTIGQERRDAQATSFVETETARPTVTPDTEDIVQGQLQNYYAELLADANVYQTQLAAASRGDGQSCLEGLFNYPSIYRLSPMWAGNENYVAVVDLLNQAHDLLDSINVPYQNACANNRPLGREDAIAYGRTTLDAQRKLQEALAALNVAGIEVTAEALITSTPRPTETLEVTPTQDLSSVRVHLDSLDIIISDMTGLQGPATHMQFYWQQVMDTSALYRSGCNQPPSVISNNYNLPLELEGQFPQLDTAVTNVNLALDTLRIVQDSFYESCRAEQVPEDAAGRLAQANFVLAAFDSARNEIDALRGR